MAKARLIRLSYLAIAVLVCFFVGKNIYSLFFNNYQTMKAQMGELTQMVEMDGAILHSETVIESSHSGRLVFEAGNNERVKVGSLIASIWTGEFDEALYYELAGINSQLEELEKKTDKKAFYSLDLGQKRAQIALSAKNVIEYSEKRQYEKIGAEKRAVHNMIDTSSVDEKKAKIDGLKARKGQIESEISAAKKEIFSKQSGVLVTYIDGNENFLSVKERNKITPNMLKFDSDKIAKLSSVTLQGQPICKVVDNYTWYYLGVVDAKLAGQIRVGDSVALSFSAISGRSINATIENVNEALNGECIVVFLCNQEIEESYLIRETSCIMEFKNYMGIKLPKSAIRMVNGQTGVYIVKSDKAAFRKVEVLYSNEIFAIIDESKTDLKLYDEVVIKGMRLREGKAM
ncbi:MAG: hypothetical protein FWE47_03780 [Oscillospiraceae bacterium]|nr:hypothetical protein [Oscillospiraceae bacterium]